MSDEIQDAISSNAQGPKRAQGDSGSVEQHSLREQIEADRYLQSKSAAKVGIGIRIVKRVAPGAV